MSLEEQKLEELKKEHRSVRAPTTALAQVVSQFEIRQSRRGFGGIPGVAWSFVAVVLLGFVIYPVWFEPSPSEGQPVVFNLTGLVMPVGPAMPSLTTLSAPPSAKFVAPRLNQIALLPARWSSPKSEMETI